MSRKTKKPKFPNSYIGEKAEEYDESIWMQRNQKKTTLLCIQYLFDDQLDRLNIINSLQDIPYLVLDLGCGTGFSSETLLENGFKVIGIDILKDMIFKARDRMKRYDKKSFLEYILADINQLPFRGNSIDHIISISAYNFIINTLQTSKEKNILLTKTAQYLNTILKPNSRMVLEFYPNDEEELNQFKSSFINNGFNGFMIKQNPNQKSGQTFLLLKKA